MRLLISTLIIIFSMNSVAFNPCETPGCKERTTSTPSMKSELAPLTEHQNQMSYKSWTPYIVGFTVCLLGTLAGFAVADHQALKKIHKAAKTFFAGGASALPTNPAAENALAGDFYDFASSGSQILDKSANIDTSLQLALLADIAERVETQTVSEVAEEEIQSSPMPQVGQNIALYTNNRMILTSLRMAALPGQFDYDNHVSTITIQGLSYLLVNSPDSNYSDLSQAMALIGGPNRDEPAEILTLSLEDEKILDEVYDRLIQHLGALPNTLSQEEFLAVIRSFVREHVFTPSLARTVHVISVIDQFLDSEGAGIQTTQRPMAVMPIGRFIEARAGICRHHALVFSYLFDRLIKDNKARPLHPFSGSTRSHINYGEGHVWNVVVTMNNNQPSIFHVDAQWNLQTQLSHQTTLRELRFRHIESLRRELDLFLGPQEVLPSSLIAHPSPEFNEMMQAGIFFDNNDLAQAAIHYDDSTQLENPQNPPVADMDALYQARIWDSNSEDFLSASGISQSGMSDSLKLGGSWLVVPKPDTLENLPENFDGSWMFL